MSVPTSSRPRFRPGDMAPVSGIYLVTHADEHREPHEALIIRGEELPHCRTCKGAVTYEVLRPTSHITHEWDFAGPTGLAVRAHPPNGAEVRRWPRSPVALAVLIQSRRSDASLAAQANDISEGGINLSLEGASPPAEIVKVQLLTPDQPPLVLRARLRHSHGSRCGFEFLRLGDDDRRLLRERFRL